MSEAASVNLVVVADDERVHKALTFADKVTGIKRRRISNLDERFTVENRRNTLFLVQNRFGGLTGESLVEYLKTKYRADKAKFFLVGNPSEMKDLPRRVVARRINIDLDTDKLSACLKDAIMKHAPDGMDVSGLVTEDVSISPVARKSTAVLDQTWPPKEVSDTAGATEFIRRVKEASGQFASPQHIARVERDVINGIEKPASLTALRAGTRTSAGPTENLESGRPRKVYPYTLMTVTFAAVILAAAMHMTSSSKPKAKALNVPAKRAAAVGVAVPGYTKTQTAADPLPSFIPVTGRDLLFSKANPGWERYDGKHCEFRLFRDKGRIEVMQVIAKKDHVVADSLLASAAGEKVAGRRFRASKKSMSGGFSVERVVLSNKREIALYRRKSIREPVAIAVKF